MSDQLEKIKDKGPKDDEVTLEVATPKGPWKGNFPKTTKIAEVIKTIMNDLSLPNESYQLVYNGKALEPQERPLVSFGLTGTVKLVMVATGSGV